MFTCWELFKYSWEGLYRFLYFNSKLVLKWSWFYLPEGICYIGLWDCKPGKLLIIWLVDLQFTLTHIPQVQKHNKVLKRNILSHPTKYKQNGETLENENRNIIYFWMLVFYVWLYGVFQIKCPLLVNTNAQEIRNRLRGGGVLYFLC